MGNSGETDDSGETGDSGEIGDSGDSGDFGKSGVSRREPCLVRMSDGWVVGGSVKSG